MMNTRNECTSSDSSHSGVQFVNEVKDPPGQKSKYIPPGDHVQEIYRLSTFKDFPATVLINTCQLASLGFHYTGFKDRVKCFSCGQAIENWKNYNGCDLATLHKPQCDFINGRDVTNVPIHSNFLAMGFTPSAPGVSSRQAGALPVAVARSANQHPPSAASLTTSVSSGSSGKTQIPLSVVAASRAVDSVPIPQNARGLVSATSRASADPFTIFPCLHPANPRMQNENDRLQTFLDNSVVWPAHRINATPQEISQAGMYYLGERDQVKCWYCNGGLQNWDRNDVPWIEHAKWFPMCEFLLRMKGPAFVHSVLAQYPNLRRPALYNPANTALSNTKEVQPDLRPSSFSSSSTGRASNSDDPRDRDDACKREVVNEMKSSGLVSQAKMMGFNHGVIETALLRQYETRGRSFSNIEELIDSLVGNETQTNEVGATESASSSHQVEPPHSNGNGLALASGKHR